MNFLIFFFQGFRHLDIYTDGSHKGRWGSWAYVIVHRGKIIREAAGRERKTNSHRMEFQAAIEALKALPPHFSVTLFTDSRVLLKSMTEPLKRTPINLDQIDILKSHLSNPRISWAWIKAHAGHVFNERCDHLCSEVRKAI